MSELGQVIDARTLRLERVLPASIEKVWSFLVDPGKRSRWLAGGDAPKSGQTIELRFENDKLTGEEPPEKFKAHGGVHLNKCRVIELDAPRRLVMSWGEGGSTPSEVSFDLSAIDAGSTRLVLVHSRLPARGQMLSVAGGWHAHVDLLIDLLAGRTPKPFWPNLAEKNAAYDKLIPA